MSLKKIAINGIKWTGISSIVKAIFHLAQISILTSFLAAEEFGLMAIVSVVIGFSGLFMDMGVSSAIIQKQNITHRQLSSLYWLNICAGLLISSTVYFMAPLFAIFYNEDRIIPLIQLLACTFVISAIGNQFRILKQKELCFNQLAKVEIFSGVLSFITAITLAFSGYGVYSLVYSTLLGVSISSLIFFISGIKDHKPSFTYNHNAIKSMIGFGLYQMGEKSINYFNGQFDIILIGKLLGPEVLGIYSIAKSLVSRPAQIINPIVTRVTFPIMSTIQNDNVRLKNIYLKTVNYLCSINFPIYLAIIILAEPLVLLLFGDNWIDSIIIVRILSIYFLLRSISNPVGSLQYAKGRADMGFYWNFSLLMFTPITIYFGSFLNISGVAISLVILQVILIIPHWFLIILPLCGAHFKEYFAKIVTPCILSIVTSFFVFIVLNTLNINSMPIFSFSFLCLSLLVYLGLLFKFNKEFVNVFIKKRM